MSSRLRRQIALFVVVGATSATLVAARPTAARHTASVKHGRDPAYRVLSASSAVDFDLVLRLRQRALSGYVYAVLDPSSPLYGHYISPARFGQLFGIGKPAVRRLEQQLRRLGFAPIESWPQEIALRVRATAATIRRVFGVSLREYTEADGETYQLPSRTPVLPPELRRWVAVVSELDTRLDLVPDALPNLLTPAEVRNAYNITPLYIGGDDGQGQTVGVLSPGQYSRTAFQKFSTKYGISGPAPQTDVLGSISGNGSAADSAREADLDLEVIHAIAPAAQIINYEISEADLPDEINTIVGSGRTTLVSASWGMCDGTITDPPDDRVPFEYRSEVESALEAAALAGVTFLFASGDTGSYACLGAYKPESNLTVSFPADAPWAVAVGGTTLSLSSDGGYGYETGWADNVGAGGGGLNPYDAAPPWQSSAYVWGVSNGNRQLPDVAGPAGLASPWSVNDGSRQYGPAGFDEVGGTSAATPFWAASLALVQQYVQHNHAGPLCFAAPLLYDTAELSWTYPPFHDITLGGNGYYNAGPGWNFATGWGSPNVFNLATAIVSYRAKHPLPTAANACRSILP